MWFSDLENLLSIGRIFYQLGESYLNLFLLHKVENLWSVRNLWSILTSLSAFEDFLSNLGEEGGGAPYPQISNQSIHDFEPNMSYKMLSFCDSTFFILVSNWSMVCPGKALFWVILYPLPALLSYSFLVITFFDQEKRISYPSLLLTPYIRQDYFNRYLYFMEWEQL